MRKSLGILLLVVAAAVPGTVLAAETDYFPNYERVRVLGMGGAFTAVADSEDAAFYNPAGLNNLTAGKVTIFDPTIELSREIYDIYKDYDDVNTDNEAQISDFLKKHVGETSHFRFMLTPGYACKNFAFYVLGNGSLEARIRNQADPVADVVAVGDAGGQISGAYAFLNGMIQVGATGRVTKRWSVIKTYTTRALLDNTFSLEDDALKGTGVAFDAGVIVKIPYQALGFEPSAGLVVKDIGSPGFGDAVGNKQDVRFGLGAKRDFDLGRLTLAADVRRIGHGGEDFSKKIYVGGEFAFKKILALRAGLYQGYLSAGAALDLWILQVSYATYAAEMGAFAGQADDRRHTVQLSFAF
jgi:hypothetical protein